MKKIIILTALAAIAIQTTIAGTITGIVTDDSTGLPIPDMLVYAISYDTGHYCSDGTTNSDGVYSISGLAEGEYRVGIINWGINYYVEEYYDNTLEYENAEAVFVTSSEVTQNIDFGLTMGGTISGIVIDPDGQPVEWARVYAYDYATNLHRGSDFTDSEGFYSISGLVAGTYRIEVRPYSGSNYVMQYYNGQNDIDNAAPVVVGTGGIVEDINFQLALGGGISGIVTDPNGLPVSGIQVSAYNYTTYQHCGTDWTDSEGLYSIHGLAAGTYRVEVYPAPNTNYVMQFYDGQYDWENATPVVVNAGDIIEDINFQFILGGSISGKVIDPNGLPVAGVQVSAYNYTTSHHQGADRTNSEGLYSINSLAAGTYRIVAYSDRGSLYRSQFYDGQDDWENATPVIAEAGGVVEGINFRFALGGGIRGIVTDPNGLPVSNVRVSVVGYRTNYVDSVFTNVEGIYEVGSLPAGIYNVTVYAEDTIYSSQLYNNKVVWDQTATPINVSVGQWTTGIDFSLNLGVSISGVVKNSSGVAQANAQMICGADGISSIIQTDSNGYYEFSGLAIGYTYNVIACPPIGSDYVGTRIKVSVNQAGKYEDQDIVFNEGGLTISGRITAKATMLPLANIRVGCWNNDFWIWTETRSDANGRYELAHLPADKVNIHIQPDSYYADMMVRELQLQENIYNLDFALPIGATLCGKVLDARTAQPLFGIEVEYSNEEYSIGAGVLTDIDGSFCLTQLPPGIAEVKAKPAIDSGYAWNLPDGGDFVCLDEGENRSGRMIALDKGALVSGYMKDAAGNPLGGFEYYYSGRDSDGGSVTDINGFYQMRLPVGTYFITVDDNDEFGALPAIVTVTDINENINVPDITVYTEVTGGQISGQISNPGPYAKMGVFTMVAFKAGTLLNDPDLWYTAQPAVVMGMENAGPFSLDKLPSGANYDLYLCVDYETPDIESLAIRDSVLNVAPGATGITLEYNSQGGTVTGTVINTDGYPVLGATVILWGSSGFSGFTQTDCGGQYVIYNVPAGAYTATAIRSKYLIASTSLEVVESVTADADDMVMSFEGNKEGPDLNGDGKLNMGDLTAFAGQWLNSGTSQADFNQDNLVNLYDWSRIAENWLSKAIWYHE